MKENKGLSDRQLVEKYESGAIDISKIIKESQEKYEPVKRIVTDRANKKPNKTL